jgi:hypothetical protein
VSVNNAVSLRGFSFGPRQASTGRPRILLPRGHNQDPGCLPKWTAGVTSRASGMQRAICFHEAGHAAVAVALGLGVAFVSAAPHDPHTLHRPVSRHAAQLQALLVTDLCGPLAEARAIGCVPPWASADDEVNAWHRALALRALAGHRGDTAGARRLVEAARQTAALCVDRYWPAIAAVATMLLGRDLTGVEVARLVRCYTA